MFPDIWQIHKVLTIFVICDVMSVQFFHDSIWIRSWNWKCQAWL